MKNSFLIQIDDAIDNDSYLQSFTGTLVPEELAARIAKSFPELPVYYSVSKDYQGSLNRENILVRSGSIQSDWKTLFETSGSDNIIRVFGDAPFTDMSIVSEMLDIHTKYVAEYTYSENVPSGFGCDILSSVLINSLPDETEEKKALPLEKVIKDNINQFDVELYYKKPDIRHKRLSFRTADKREFAICSSLYSIENQIPAYSEIENLIHSHPEVLYQSPSYIELQLNYAANTTPVFAHPLLNSSDAQMDQNTLEAILSGMRDFGLQYNIALTFGDPLLHKKFYTLLDLILKEDLLESIIIETEAAFTDSNFFSFLEEKKDDRIKVVVSCNGYNSETYSAIHCSDIFETVQSNILKLKELLDTNLYLEIKKINETEPFLDLYYDFWENYNVQLILQKQNTWIGAAKDRRYYDLTPLKRIPCWHLQRDLYILPDGSVPYCKQDVGGKFSSYNVNSLPISEIWENRKPMFIQDYKGNLPASPDCKSCDEWFTFNL